LSQSNVNWYAVHTRSRFEKVVHSELALKGLESFLPAVEEVHRWKDRKKLVERPIFPGYVFARFADAPEARVRVLKTHGAVRILGCVNSIEAVPDWELDSIRRLIKTQCQFAAHPFLKEGAWVRVKRGPLQDVEGRLVRFRSQARLVLSIDLLSQAVATEVDASDVEVISPRR
jgi:transcription termination/antitermination protein NusG